MASHEQYQVRRVFIASPGDLAEERKLFPDVLNNVNEIKAHGLGIHLEPVGWEDTLPGMGRPQGKINEDVDKCDLFVMLLWKRWGTPSGEYSSGTEEEFELARKLHAERGKPADIWLYCRSVPDEMLADPGEQLSKVLEFRKKTEAERTCLYKWYSEPPDWLQAFTTHLCQWLDRDDRPTHLEKASAEVPLDIQVRLEELEQRLEQERKARESAQHGLRLASLNLALRATKAADEGRRTEAEQDYATAVQTYPEPLVMSTYAKFLHGSDRLPDAEAMYHRALQADPRLASAWLNLGVLLHTTGRQDEAEKAYRKAIEFDPKDADTWVSLGLLLGETDRQDEAEKAYRKAINIDSKHVNAWLGLVVLLSDTDRQDEAEQACRKAIKIDAKHANAWFALGGLLSDADRQSEAEQACRKAIEIDPEHANAWCLLGDILSDADRQDEAEQAYRKAIKTDPKHANAWYSLGVGLGKTDRQDEAEKAYRKAIEFDPKDAGNYNALAYLLWSVGRVDEAEVEVGKALELDPNCAYAHATLGLLELEKNDLDGGRERYAKAIELEPDDLPLRQKYHFEYGRALARNGREDEAREHLQAALNTDATYVPKEQIEADLAKIDGKPHK